MKKQCLSILYVVSVSLIISGTILFSKPEKTSHISTSYSGMISNGLYGNDKEINAAHEINLAPIPDIELLVLNNSPSIAVHAALTDKEQGLFVLKLSYRLNGKQVKRVINASKIHEIRRIVSKNNNRNNSVEVKSLLLNSKMSRLYIPFQSKTDKGYTHSAIYSYDLKSSRVEKIYSQAGYLKDFSLSPDESYYAFSCVNQIKYADENKANSVVIFKCNNNCEIFNSTREVFKLEMNPAYDFNYYYLYSYYLSRWGSNNTCEINRGIISKDGREAPIIKTLLLNLETGEVTE